MFEDDTTSQNYDVKDLCAEMGGASRKAVKLKWHKLKSIEYTVFSPYLTFDQKIHNSFFLYVNDLLKMFYINLLLYILF